MTKKSAAPKNKETSERKPATSGEIDRCMCHVDSENRCPACKYLASPSVLELRNDDEIEVKKEDFDKVASLLLCQHCRAVTADAFSKVAEVFISSLDAASNEASQVASSDAVEDDSKTSQKKKTKKKPIAGTSGEESGKGGENPIGSGESPSVSTTIEHPQGDLPSSSANKASATGKIEGRTLLRVPGDNQNSLRFKLQSGKSTKRTADPLVRSTNVPANNASATVNEDADLLKMMESVGFPEPEPVPPVDEEDDVETQDISDLLQEYRALRIREGKSFQLPPPLEETQLPVKGRDQYEGVDEVGPWIHVRKEIVHEIITPVDFKSEVDRAISELSIQSAQCNDWCERSGVNKIVEFTAAFHDSKPLPKGSPSNNIRASINLIDAPETREALSSYVKQIPSWFSLIERVRNFAVNMCVRRVAEGRIKLTKALTILGEIDLVCTILNLESFAVDMRTAVMEILGQHENNIGVKLYQAMAQKALEECKQELADFEQTATAEDNGLVSSDKSTAVGGDKRSAGEAELIGEDEAEEGANGIPGSTEGKAVKFLRQLVKFIEDNPASKTIGFWVTFNVRVTQVNCFRKLFERLKEAFKQIATCLMAYFPFAYQGFTVYDQTTRSPLSQCAQLPKIVFEASNLPFFARFAQDWFQALNIPEFDEADYCAYIKNMGMCLMRPDQAIFDAAEKGFKTPPKAVPNFQPIHPIVTRLLTKFGSTLFGVSEKQAELCARYSSLFDLDKEKIPFVGCLLLKDEQLRKATLDILSVVDFQKSKFAPANGKKVVDSLLSVSILKSFQPVGTNDVVFGVLVSASLRSMDMFSEQQGNISKYLAQVKLKTTEVMARFVSVAKHPEPKYKPIVFMLVAGEIMSNVVRSNRELGCVRSLQNDDVIARELAGERGAQRIVQRLVTEIVTAKMWERELCKAELTTTEREKRKKEQEERKRQEEKDRRAQEKAAEEARKKQEQKEREEREELEKQARLEKEQKELEEARKRAEEKQRLLEQDQRLLQVQRAEAAAERKRKEEEERRKELERQSWTCNRCTMLNTGTANVCAVCEFGKGLEWQEVVLPSEEDAPEEPTSTEEVGSNVVAPVESEPVPHGPRPIFNVALSAGEQSQVPADEAYLSGSHVGETHAIAPGTQARASSKVVGLSNEVGENSCFLNVVVQSLWHLRSFSSEFMQARENDHRCLTREGQSCLVCSLRATFHDLNAAQDSLVSSSQMRKALSDAFGGLFSLGEKEDAGEAFESILKTLHQALQYSGAAEHGRDDSQCRCHVHNILGSTFFEGVDCRSCRKAILKTNSFDAVKHAKSLAAFQKYELIPSNESFTCFVRYVPAVVISGIQGEFQERLCSALEVEPISCPVCDKKGLEVERLMTKPSSIYTLGIVWTTHQASSDDIKSFLEGVSEHVDLVKCEGRVVTSHQEQASDASRTQLAVLRGMMCYYGSHYAAFFRPAKEFNPEETWFMFDDSMVKPIGDKWIDVARSCLASKFQPVALFYENDPSLNVAQCSFSGVTL